MFNADSKSQPSFLTLSLTTFVTIGDNPHDDAVDSITQLEMFVEGNGNKGATVEAVVNPFRMTGGYGYYGY